MTKNLKSKYDNQELKVDSGIVGDFRNYTAKLMNLSINLLENRVPKDVAEILLHDYAIELIDFEEEFMKISKKEKQEKDK